jgi:hypothetical protein
MDRDGKTISPKLNDTKSRIQTEIGENNVWITRGREIENYLSKPIIENWIFTNHKMKISFENDVNTKLEDSISKVDASNKLKYNLNKNKYASEITAFIELDQMNILDLKEKINTLVSSIKAWNKMQL